MVMLTDYSVPFCRASVLPQFAITSQLVKEHLGQTEGKVSDGVVVFAAARNSSL